MANSRLANYEFFKVILPGSSKTKLKLPDKFVRELEHEHGQILRDAKLHVAGRRRQLWDVRVVVDDVTGGAYLTRGWLQFTRAHDIGDGLFLVFRFDGAATFAITVFDPTMCRRDYYRHDAGESGSSSSGGGDGDCDSDSDASEGDGDGGGGDVATSQFAVTLRLCNLGEKQAQYLNVPVEFQEAHGYAKRAEVALRMRGRTWTVRLKHSRKQKGQRAALRYGWHQFCVDNGLAVGDTCFFRLLPVPNHAGAGDDDDGDHVLKVSVRKADGTFIE
uniref:TF-B3 domain-containing protein n=1 Tax=Leersia perrieri TaxID=77586 RepID=A0A0D9VR52_9ORYZ